MPQPNTISPQKLMRLIGTPDAPRVIDVRIPDDLAANPALIPSAVRQRFDDTDFGGGPAVVVCHEGKKLSHGVAATLRARGEKAEVLEGGAVAWVAAGLPMIPLGKLDNVARWVTRQRPKVDRIACAWLIRRFINPEAEILFVPQAEVQSVADRFDAVPFDAEGADLSHRGDQCSFDAIIADFGLGHPALLRLADVVRAADTNRHDLAPQAAGLLAISVGLSRLCRDDDAQLATALPLYDALYRWARDGFEETHETALDG